MWYFLPYAFALILPPRFNDVAAGICLGAVLTDLPFTLFFNADLVRRSVVDEGSSLPALIAAAMLTMGCVILYGLVLSAR